MKRTLTLINNNVSAV